MILLFLILRQGLLGRKKIEGRRREEADGANEEKF